MRAIRIGSRTGREKAPWPVLALLLAAVLLPSGFLLWFMNEALRQERALVRQQLADAYRVHLSLARDRVAAHWQSKIRALEEVTRSRGAGEAFAAIVRGRLADAALIFDAQGTLLYPAPLEARVPKAPPQGHAWEEAQAAEFEW